MSLLYIIDGYNITNHPLFAKLSSRKLKDSREALLELIAHRALCGSAKNKATVVFDGRGYYGNRGLAKDDSEAISVVFAGEESADDRILKIAQASHPPNTVVVSDDKQVRIFARSIGCSILSVEEFIDYRQKTKVRNIPQEEPELNYTQKDKINRELRKLWLEK